ncbi:MAG: hypothetical protein AUJ72_04490 [Candidatus Omnitrophica bacterium CG1_02_46_14]|nr:MAG: hypothetical protein AUJ72_04490 [Candidatus Omnitrophica bacterium CG1_02_46_14]
MISSKKELDQHFMRQALKEAEKAFEAGEVPVGAILVHEQKVIGRAYNQVKLLKDPTAHAEILVITQGSEALQSEHLRSTTLYVTLEPCPMCVGAMILARIERLVFGARESKTGACGSKIHLLAEAKWSHQFKIEEGVLEFESVALLQEFFRTKR